MIRGARWLDRSDGTSTTNFGRWSSHCCRRSSVGPGTPGESGIRTGWCSRASCFVLHTGIAWEHLPQELGFGSGMTCWRRLAEWTEVGVWPRLHEVLLAKLPSTNALDFSRAAVDGSHIRALKGVPRPDEAPLTGAGRAASTT